MPDAVTVASAIIDLAVDHLRTWIETNNTYALLGLYIVLRVIAEKFITWSVRRLGYGWAWWVPRPIRWLIWPIRPHAPPPDITSWVSHLDRTDQGSLTITEPGRHAKIAFVGVSVMVGIIEEIVFRGLPLYLATDPGMDVVLIGLATGIWAFGHGFAKGLALVLTTGWLLALLWLNGLWFLAMVLHGGSNLVAAVEEYRRRVEDRQAAERLDDAAAPSDVSV